MPVPPTGTVTFLFTDVEGSTQLARLYPEAMPAALTRHHAILRDAIDSHQGYLFRTLGDEFEVAFPTAQAGLDAALTAQRALHAMEWGATGPLRVRMGLHTGQATPRGDDYDGYLTLAHTKRLMSTAVGEQVLVSEATETLVRDQLSEGVTLRDLGAHRLKGFDNAEHIYQVCAAGLPSDFPPLASLDTHPNNLPAQLTSFVGREKELRELKELLRTTRLLTLTGPGGTGKTRLSLELATQVVEEYKDGAWLVELAPVADPALVPQAVATALGVREQPQRTILDAVKSSLRAKNLLLILDNCEHLIDASARLVEALLQSSPGLKIVASSREGFGIAGETIFRVPSLNVPEDGKPQDLALLEQNDCVRLFVERARAVYPRFRLSDKNARAIVEICERLDGIPLALELAAARAKVFTPDQIAARLDDRFRLLTGGSRTALERHQTLFALIEWSYHLLSESERTLLRRLSVFAGGWTFEAAQAVCGDGLAEDVLDLLMRLVDKSLVEIEEQAEGRYRMLETIRQYARDRLFEEGESPTVRERHLEFYLRYAEMAEPKLRAPEQLEWLERLETEHDNMRAALAWGLESGTSDRMFQFLGALSWFWTLRGNLQQGYKWTRETFALGESEQKERIKTGQTTPPTRDEVAHRAKAIYGSAYFELVALEWRRARERAEESLRLWRELGDKWWITASLSMAALFSRGGGDDASAAAYLEEAESVGRQVDDPWPLAVCLNIKGDGLKGSDPAAARRYLEEDVALARRIGDRSLISDGLRELGAVYYIAGDHATGLTMNEEAYRYAKELGSVVQIFLVLGHLIAISCLENQPEKVRSYDLVLRTMLREVGSPFVAIYRLLSLGCYECFFGQAGRGVTVLTAAEELMRKARGNNFTSSNNEPLLVTVYAQAEGAALSKLGAESFEAAEQEGRQMTMERLLALAEMELPQ